MSYDAIVIGGGPAGATAALMLARGGWSVAVVEKKTFPRRKVCGEFISATSQPVLDALGIGEAFRAAAGPDVRRVGLYANDAVLTAAMPQPPATGAKWGRALSRERLDVLLLDAAARAGATLWQPWSAEALARAGGGWRCTIADKSGVKEIAARIAIAAHGSWERGPAPAPAFKSHAAADLIAFKAHFRNSALAAGLMPLVTFPGGYGGMVATDDGRVTLSCCIRRDALARCRQRYRTAQAGEAVLAHVTASSRGAREALSHARRDGPWLSAGPIRPGIRRRYDGGVFFAGNIAGEAHPVVAEGISMAMQSAWLLCSRLIARQDDVARAGALDAVGAAYAADWNAAFAMRVRAAAVFAQFAMRPAASTLALPVLRRFPDILTFGAQLSGKARAVVAA
jgi:flavin-dependent dehydrogenase